MHTTPKAYILNREEKKTDLRKVFAIIWRYRVSILFIMIISTILAALFAYFKPDIYSTTSTIEIGKENRNVRYSSQNSFESLISPDTVSSDAEVRLVKSYYLTNQALSNVDFSRHYYATVNFKEEELYKSSPFDVNLSRGYHISFIVHPYSESQYRVDAQGEDKKSGEKWKYSHVHNYGKTVQSKYFSFTLDRKKDRTLDNLTYRFVVLDEESAVEAARKEVSVSPMDEMSTVLDITVQDNVPLRSQELNNALAEAYIAQSVYRKTREASKTLSFINAQLKQINNNLKNSAVKLEHFKKETNTVNIDSKSKGVMERLSNAEAALATIDIEVGLLNSLYSQVKAGKHLETISTSGLGSSNGVNDPGTQALTNIIQELQRAVMKLRLLRADFTEQYPEVVKLKRQIAQMKKIIIDMIKNIKRNYDERQKLLQKSIAEQTKLMEKLPENERIYGTLQRKFVVNEKIYSFLLEKQAATAIEKASTISRNWIMDHARYPREPISPDRKLIILAGLIFGLILGVLLALLRDYLDDTIKTEEDIKLDVDVPQLGIIPHYAGKEDGKLKVVASPKSAVAEAFRNIRTNLQFMAPGKGAHVISVTSTVGSEGKTTVCANLGSIFSMANKKTIVLNMDMRKPTLHQKFQLDNRIGMSTLLSSNSTLPEAIQHTSYENLDIISSGPIPPNPSELIQSDRMLEILGMLRKAYEVIILDTPPIGLVTDARTLMQLSDTTIYLLRSAYTKKASLKLIDRLLKGGEIRGFGIVLNDVNMKSYGYGYGYDYGYYEEGT